MASTARAQDLGSIHQQAVIRPCDHGMLERFPEARPTGAAVKLRCRAEQGQGAARASKDAFAMLIQERARKGSLGRCLTKDGVALGAERLAPLCR